MNRLCNIWSTALRLTTRLVSIVKQAQCQRAHIMNPPRVVSEESHAMILLNSAHWGGGSADISWKSGRTSKAVSEKVQRNQRIRHHRSDTHPVPWASASQENWVLPGFKVSRIGQLVLIGDTVYRNHTSGSQTKQTVVTSTWSRYLSLFDAMTRLWLSIHSENVVPTSNSGLCW